MALEIEIPIWRVLRHCPGDIYTHIWREINVMCGLWLGASDP